MRIVWLSWKDRSHLLAGGAEVLTSLIINELVAAGHEVKLLTSRPDNSLEFDSVKTSQGSYEIYRRGSRLGVYSSARKIYKENNLRDWADVVIDEMNTIPFFARYYSGKPTVLFVHQLAREIWFHEMPKLIGVIGYLSEALYLRLMSKSVVVTVSQSTKKDLERFGFKQENIQVIPEAIEHLDSLIKQKPSPKTGHISLVSLGYLRSMKQTLHQIEAFEIAKNKIPELTLDIIGGGLDTSYGKKVQKRWQQSAHKQSITLHGFTSVKERTTRLAQSHYMLATSVKEGWCLTVSEAALSHTPTLGYDVDGLRDSIENDKTGRICAPNPHALAQLIIDSYEHTTKKQYVAMQKRAYLKASDLNAAKTAKELLEAIAAM
jgi:glycosyltransferase involved in cell wall biosynthesis